MVRNEVWGTQQAADELNRLTRDLAAAREELAAANATVEEKPIVGTTGDGVSVRVGQPIYRATPTHIEIGYAQADGSVGGPKMWACSVGMYFSTPTAAEAAREGKESGDTNSTTPDR
jgi:hypothetical protein